MMKCLGFESQTLNNFANVGARKKLYNLNDSLQFERPELSETFHTKQKWSNKTWLLLTTNDFFTIWWFSWLIVLAIKCQKMGKNSPRWALQMPKTQKIFSLRSWTTKKSIKTPYLRWEARTSQYLAFWQKKITKTFLSCNDKRLQL